MFAINHAATALIVKHRYPSVAMPWLLVSVQLMEIMWVAFNYLGVEQTTTGVTVESVRDIHLTYMPYSHSIVSAIGLSFVAWLIASKWLRKPAGLAIAVGIVSHLILDLVTHAPDIAIAPGLQEPKVGLGLYGALPLAAFVLELAYGMFCWWIYRGRRGLLLIIVIFNLADLPLLSPAVPGPESQLAGRPLMIVTIIAAQIVITLLLVGIFSAGRRIPAEKHEFPVPPISPSPKNNSQ